MGKVWIDQDLCTGDGLCTEIAPDVFEMHNNGLAYVKSFGQTALCGDDGEPLNQGPEGIADFREEQMNEVLESAEECPGECIFIEP